MRRLVLSACLAFAACDAGSGTAAPFVAYSGRQAPVHRIDVIVIVDDEPGSPSRAALAALADRVLPGLLAQRADGAADYVADELHWVVAGSGATCGGAVDLPASCPSVTPTFDARRQRWARDRDDAAFATSVSCAVREARPRCDDGEARNVLELLLPATRVGSTVAHEVLVLISTARDDRSTDDIDEWVERVVPTSAPPYRLDLGVVGVAAADATAWARAIDSLVTHAGAGLRLSAWVARDCVPAFSCWIEVGSQGADYRFRLLPPLRVDADGLVDCRLFETLTADGPVRDCSELAHLARTSDAVSGRCLVAQARDGVGWSYHPELNGELRFSPGIEPTPSALVTVECTAAARSCIVSSECPIGTLCAPRGTCGYPCDPGSTRCYSDGTCEEGVCVGAPSD